MEKDVVVVSEAESKFQLHKNEGVDGRRDS